MAPRKLRVRIPNEMFPYARLLLQRWGVAVSVEESYPTRVLTLDPEIIEKLQREGISLSENLSLETSQVQALDVSWVSSMLGRHDFIIDAVHEPFVVAHYHLTQPIQHDKTYLVKVGISSDSQGREFLFGGLVFKQSQFGTFLGQLVSYWGRHVDDYSSLDSNVLTSFGWHMKDDQSDRQNSLLGATTALGPRHVREILNLLRNTVPRNPLFAGFPEYSVHVAADLEWYSNQVANDLGPYWVQRRALVELLRNEYSKTFSKSAPVFDHYALIIPRPAKAN